MSGTSDGLEATSPRGTGTPYFARTDLAWYSWIFMRVETTNAIRPAHRQSTAFEEAGAPREALLRCERHDHSQRSARIGSIRVARYAGISPAAIDTSARSATVDPAITGSRGWIPYSCDATKRPSPIAAGIPMTRPIVRSSST